MTTPDLWHPDLGTRVSRLGAVKVGNVPVPILVRAEQLCDLVDEADGIRPDRQVLIASLILAAKDDGKALANIWQRYRTADVHEVILGAHSTNGPIDLTQYKRH